MNKFKKAFLCLAIVLMCVALALPAFAEETTIETTIDTTIDTTEETTEAIIETEEESTDAEPSTEAQEPTTEDEEPTAATLQDRLAEAWEKGDISAVLTIAFDVAIIILALVAKNASKKSAADVVSIFSEDGTYTKEQKVSVQAINALIDATNMVTGAFETFAKEMLDKMESLDGMEKEKLQAQQEQINACCKSVKCIGEMLNTTYSNSTTIPLPVKNLVAQKYIELCNTIGEADKAGGDNEG